MSADIGKITKAMTYFTTHIIEIGILGDGGSVKGKSGGSKDEITVLEYGTYVEFGTSKMKPFGFFRRTIDENQSTISNYVEGVVNLVLQGQLDGRQACMQVGEFIRGLIVESIATASGWARPTSDSYNKWKTKNYPNRAGQTLILDGFLIKSIRYKIKKGDSAVYTSSWAKV